MSASAKTKKELHELIDKLPEGEVAAAKRYLEYLREKGDPFFEWLQSLPEEKEELSAEGRSALAEGDEAIDQGEVVSDEELVRELDL